MASRRTLTAVTLTVLVAMLAAGAFIGWRALFAPLPGDSDAATGNREGCAEGVSRGDTVRTRDVTVSVYNASNRDRLASRTMAEFVNAGFVEGETGNAPEDARVPRAKIWARSLSSPDVRLVKSRLGPATPVVRRNGPGIGVTVLVGDRYTSLVKGRPSVKALAMA